MPSEGPGGAPTDAVPRSCVPGIVWPAIPDEPGARVLALQYQLSQSEWWRPEVLGRRQERQLAALVRHAAESVPHYQDSLPAGLIDGAGLLDRGRWREVPILTRAAAHAAGMALSGTAMPGGHGAMTVVRTGGSTGRRLEIACTAVALALREAFGLRDHLWHRRDLSAKLAVIAAEEARRAGWGASAGAAYETGPCVTLDIACGIAAQAAWLAREDPDYLLTTAGNAANLAQHFEQHGVRLARLREVRTTGAPPGAAVRPAWPVPLSDVYAASEAGCLALRCPEQGRYHLQAEGVLVEIVDERGRPCPVGEVGRVVVTPLHNFATVLLRYDIGDEAALAEPCRCGRGLPAIAGIARRAAPEAAEVG